MTRKRVHAKITGRVQGVFFRAYTKEEADRLGLVGWVRNRADGSVEALAEGEVAAVDQMIEWFHGGSPHAKVTSVEVTEEKPVGECRSFEIHYY